MLKAEKKVRDWDDDLYLCKEEFNKDVTALIHAVRKSEASKWRIILRNNMEAMRR